VSTFVLLQITGVEPGNNFAVIKDQTTWDNFRLWKDNMKEGNKRWCSWLSRRKVAASIPDGVIGISFYWHDPLGRTVVLGSAQPLT
jgi:hypothetical protein